MISTDGTSYTCVIEWPPPSAASNLIPHGLAAYAACSYNVVATMLNCQNALLAHIYFVQFVMKNWFQCCSCLFTRNGSVIHLECGLELDWPVQEK